MFSCFKTDVLVCFSNYIEIQMFLWPSIPHMLELVRDCFKIFARL